MYNFVYKEQICSRDSLNADQAMDAKNLSRSTNHMSAGSFDPLGAHCAVNLILGIGIGHSKRRRGKLLAIRSAKRRCIVAIRCDPTMKLGTDEKDGAAMST